MVAMYARDQSSYNSQGENELTVQQICWPLYVAGA